MNAKYIVCLLIFLVDFSTIFSQEDEVLIDITSRNIYDEMTLEELFDLEVVVTSSKRPEDLFEAPLSVTIITREEIVKSGALSIPEALRLTPGLIVREQTPGNFDIHIRGFDDITTNFIMPTPNNTMILVMIDNRVVYDYFAGGTFWETLPIDIVDIERIEVVRGPAGALYGPNAVGGVINIITSHGEDYGWNARIRTSTGNDNANKVTGTIGYNANDKLKFSFSGYYQTRNRFDRKYFDWKRKQYVERDSLTSYQYLPDGISIFEVSDINKPKSDRAIDNYAGNIFIDYCPNESTEMHISFGHQNSVSQKIFYNNFFTPFSEYKCSSTYYNINTRLHDMFARFSGIKGENNSNVFWNSYEYENFDAVIEYSLDYSDFHLRPGINFRNCEYSGELISDEGAYDSNIDDRETKRTISNTAFSVLADYKPVQQLRLITGLRVDSYNINDNIDLSYEIGFTYRLCKNNLFRFIQSKASRAPFMLDTFINEDDLLVNMIPPPERGSLPVWYIFQGEKNLDYLDHVSTEFGWRSKVSPVLTFDLEFFISELDDFTGMEVSKHPPVWREIEEGKPKELVELRYAKFRDEQSLSSEQIGVSCSFDFDFSDNFQATLFGTIQDSKIILDDLSQKEQDDYQEYDKYRFFNSSSTPGFYGGFLLNYSPLKKWNIHANYYYMNHQAYSSISFEPWDTITFRVKPFSILNAKITYNLYDNTSIYMSVRNLGEAQRQYAFADKIETTLLLGIDFNLNFEEE